MKIISDDNTVGILSSGGLGSTGAKKMTFIRIVQFIKGLEVIRAGLASVWAMARRRTKEYRRKVDAATRCSDKQNDLFGHVLSGHYQLQCGNYEGLHKFHGEQAGVSVQRWGVILLRKGKVGKGEIDNNFHK